MERETGGEHCDKGCNKARVEAVDESADGGYVSREFRHESSIGLW